MIINKENQDDLIKKQIKIIDELQEKIKLLKFDISKNQSIIFYLKRKLKRRNQVVTKAKEELSIMKRQNDYKNINYVLKILKEIENEQN